MTELTDYYCYFCAACGAEYAGWGDLPDEFDPDNWHECPADEDA